MANSVTMMDAGDIVESGTDSSDEVDRIVARKKIKISRRYCPHCKETLSYKTFRTHKRLHYDSVKSVWHEESLSTTSSLDIHTVEPPPCSPPNLSPLQNVTENESADEYDSPPSLHVDVPPFGEENDSSSSSSDGLSDGEEFGVWSEESECEEPPNVQPQVNPEAQKQNALSTWLTIVILFLHVRYHLAEIITSRIFRVLKVLLLVLGRFCSFAANVAAAFPTNFYQAAKKHNMKTEHFKRYVVCKKCHQVYHLNECFQGSGVNKRVKSCSYHGLELRKCDTVLLKTIELSTGKKVFVPYLTYCYVDLKTSMQRLLNNSEFVEACEQWRKYDSSTDMLTSVYDGNIWKEFLDVDNKAFFDGQYHYGLILNLDWFQPYKHLTYSVGVIYLSIFNLPSHIRYTDANTLLVGVLPGPTEPKATINTYLEPLVNDLLEFWNGVPLHVQGLGEKTIHCALLCVSCDSPAGRKACGFLSHSACFGCTKCKKVFAGGVGQKDYSGFDRHNWVYRCNNLHRSDALSTLYCKTKTERKQKESALGCRYSLLLTLPYFDPIRMLAIDPMHTLFLCVAKHYLQNVWLKNNLISSTQFSVIQSRVDSTKIPAGIGRIPTKIQSGFAAFTADQFKNWVLYYSLLALRGILVDDDIECWKHFVLACRILCSKHISKERLKVADLLLLKFCQRTERQYGKQVISPSMHMICHLKDCILDFGPLHEFWLFPFERFNGSLGNLPNNNKSIEIQLMKRFTNDQHILAIPQPEHFVNDFAEFLCDVPKTTGSIRDLLLPDKEWDFEKFLEQMCWKIDVSPTRNNIDLPIYYTRAVFDELEVQNLTELYCSLYSVCPSDIEITSSFMKYKHCFICSKMVGSFKSRSTASSHIMVHWKSNFFGPSPGNDVPDEVRPAQVNYFAKNSIKIQGETYTHLFVSLRWFKHHPLKNHYGKPVTVWEHDLFEMPGVHSIIPVQFISSRAVILLDKINHYDPFLLFVIPCVDF